ncbi:hypothetical protein ACWGJ9_09345 [Curtobacterium citreum]
MTNAPLTLTIALTAELADELWFDETPTGNSIVEGKLRPLGPNSFDVVQDEFLQGVTLWCKGAAEAFMLQAFEVAAGRLAVVVREDADDLDEAAARYAVASTRKPSPTPVRTSQLPSLRG